MGNTESFFYIKNDDEVNLKTEIYFTEPFSKRENKPYDLSNSQIFLEYSELFPNQSMENNNNDKMNILVNNENSKNIPFSKANNGNASEKNFNSDYLNTEKRISRIHKSYIDTDNPKIISLDQVPLYRKLFISVHPFVLNGYRIHHSVLDCFQSPFKLHNETLNIWSHFLAFLGYLTLMVYLIYSNIFFLNFKLII